MTDKIEGHLEVGFNDEGEIVVNHPDLKPDANGVGHIVFSINQAQHLSALLARKAGEAASHLRRKAAEAIPVDRTAQALMDGSPVTADHRELQENGQQKAYVVLSDAERAKGFVRPVRRTYRHLKCGSDTWMAQSIAETYARDPKFYGGTFCVQCGNHFRLMEDGKHQFEWVDDGSPVGT